MKKFSFVQHVPGYFDLDEINIIKFEFDTSEELNEHPHIKGWMNSPNFHRLSFSPSSTTNAGSLIAEQDEGRKHWVVGFITCNAELPLPKEAALYISDRQLLDKVQAELGLSEMHVIDVSEGLQYNELDNPDTNKLLVVTLSGEDLAQFVLSRGAKDDARISKLIISKYDTVGKVDDVWGFVAVATANWTHIEVDKRKAKAFDELQLPTWTAPPVDPEQQLFVQKKSINETLYNHWFHARLAVIFVNDEAALQKAINNFDLQDLERVDITPGFEYSRLAHRESLQAHNLFVVMLDEADRASLSKPAADIDQDTWVRHGLRDELNMKYFGIKDFDTEVDFYGLVWDDYLYRQKDRRGPKAPVVNLFG